MWAEVAVVDEPAVAPSPKSNAYERACPCGSVDADASAITFTGAVPLVGVTPSEATGGCAGGGGGVTDTVRAVVSLRPDALVTVTVTV